MHLKKSSEFQIAVAIEWVNVIMRGGGGGGGGGRGRGGGRGEGRRGCMGGEKHSLGTMQGGDKLYMKRTLKMKAMIRHDVRYMCHFRS